MKVKGSLTVEDLDVQNKLRVKGNLTGNYLKCKTLETKGTVNINNLTAKTVLARGVFEGKDIAIANLFSMFGNFSLCNASLNDIQLKGPICNLKDSKVEGDIFVQTNETLLPPEDKDALTSKTPLLVLKSSFVLLRDSVVLGDISFETKGIVFLYGNSEIKGKVINGEVIKD